MTKSSDLRHVSRLYNTSSSAIAEGPRDGLSQ